MAEGEEGGELGVAGAAAVFSSLGYLWSSEPEQFTSLKRPPRAVPLSLWSLSWSRLSRVV